ncbi:hypothetical protein Tsubulata_041108 [Turnera subulata]|uniref:Peroxidase n=1 Tax=Turnera subulata TaxID=218843 RepID=A0A9Q0JH89_9ROSI|nr:hypothetical protein Tsubulata_041108 [Turnera subulata]
MASSSNYFPFPIILLLPFLIITINIPESSSLPTPSSQAPTPNLSLDYYKTSCPDFVKIVRETVTSKQINNPTTAAATLRLFFHDCMVEGCDASVLVSSNSFNKAERDAHDNIALPGDGFDMIIRIKTALELTCPKTVSCADIISQATRDLVTMVGGPFYNVLLGRRDGLVSNSSRVDGNLPRTNMTMDNLISFFETRGFSIQEMVALSGAHTIGFSHCVEFRDRLFNYSPNTPTDPAINPKFAEALKKICANQEDTAMSAFNDVFTPGKFDNMYFQNLEKGLGLLATDSAMFMDKRTKPFVQLYAANQTQFFLDFGRAMEKLSVVGVKTGNEGEVRSRCDHFNNVSA